MAPGQAVAVTVVLTPPPSGSLPLTEASDELGQVWVHDAVTVDPNPNNNGTTFRVGLTGSPYGMIHISGRIVDG
ncbi:MAG: hypothetical protein KY452_13700, partial [Actinobacteria bacterium]|nr:hypothetical protein [Actinomycetota bacterium]